MYSPILKEDIVKTLYRIKRVWKKPITKIANDFIEKSLNAVDKNEVCKICIREKNNDCGDCLL